MPSLIAKHDRTANILNKVGLNTLSEFNDVEFERILNKVQWKVRDLPRFENLGI